MDEDIVFALVCAGAAVIMAAYYLTRKRRVRTFLLGSLTGLAALFILNRYGGHFGTMLPLNWFNVSGSTILGVPFVIILVIMKML